MPAPAWRQAYTLATATAGFVNGNELVGFSFRVFVSQDLVGSAALRG